MRYFVHDDQWRTAKVKIKANQAWLREHGIRGIVIWPTVYLAPPAHAVSPELLKHELTHVYQIMRDGVLLFYLKYFWYRLRFGYHDHPYEVEAHEAQAYPLTNHERKILWSLRNDSQQ
jgi:hypothetical protein